jgi:hypothetical protein
MTTAATHLRTFQLITCRRAELKSGVVGGRFLGQELQCVWPSYQSYGRQRLRYGLLQQQTDSIANRRFGRCLSA